MEETSRPPKQRGDPREETVEKIQDFFTRYYASLLSFARRYVAREVAEDVVQDVFVRLWEEHERLARVGDVPAYVYQMVRYRCLNHVRDERTRGLLARRYLAGWDEEEVDGYIEEETFRRLMEGIEELPPACHAILSLGLEGHKAAEIAERLNIAISTVKKQKQIARRILRQKLGLLVILAGCLGARAFRNFS
ncbi:MAG: sigma-70 family RNA polymerase sigma factor [Odoribacteraceae bacterium]|jgi:RNA polymerase sigma-70 factor (ECF subfamily)|nr:sigma-70 family RNA polymerase sigma factor [Odoribacteraceae bacterium]